MKLITTLTIFLSFTYCFAQKLNSNNLQKSNINIRSASVAFKKTGKFNIARYGFGYTNDENYIYISNGASKTDPYLNSIERFDKEKGKWEGLSQNLSNIRFGCMELLNNKLYIFNGGNNIGLNKYLEIYDLEKNIIEKRTSFPHPALNAGSAVWKGEIYTFGGGFLDKKYSNKLYKFNPKTFTWSELEPMPESKQTEGEIVNGKLYTIGGFNGKVSNKIHVYDIATNKWKHLFDLPMKISAHSTTVKNGKIWIVGDYENLKFLASFDPQTSEFKIYRSNMKERRHSGCAFLGDNLYIFGGNFNSYNSSSLNSTQVLKF